MLNAALAVERPEHEAPVITLEGQWFFDRPAKQVEAIGSDVITYDFEFGGSNVETINQEGKDWYFIGNGDEIYFKAEPKQGVEVSDIIYNVIESVNSPATGSMEILGPPTSLGMISKSDMLSLSRVKIICTGFPFRIEMTTEIRAWASGSGPLPGR